MQGAQVYVAIRNGEMPDFRVLDVCPVCGEYSATVECRWCGTDIAEVEELASKREAERYIQDCKDWEE